MVLGDKYQIVVLMSQGVPRAYLEYLDEQDRHSICEFGSPTANRVLSSKHYLRDWGKKVDRLLRENAGIFMDEDYEDTREDRRVARAVEAGAHHTQI